MRVDANGSFAGCTAVVVVAVRSLRLQIALDHSVRMRTSVVFAGCTAMMVEACQLVNSFSNPFSATARRTSTIRRQSTRELAWDACRSLLMGSSALPAINTLLAPQYLVGKSTQSQKKKLRNQNRCLSGPLNSNLTSRRSTQNAKNVGSPRCGDGRRGGGGVIE